MGEPRLESLGMFEVDYDRPLLYQELNGRIFYQADSIWNERMETIHRHPSREHQTGRKIQRFFLASFDAPVNRQQVIDWAQANRYEIAALEEAVAFTETLPKRLLRETIVILGTSAHQFRQKVCPALSEGPTVMDRSLVQVFAEGTFSQAFQFLLLAA